MNLLEKMAMCGKKHAKKKGKAKPSGALLSKLGGKAEILTGKDWENRKKKMKYKGVGPEWLGMGYYKNKKKKKGKKGDMKKVASSSFLDELAKLGVATFKKGPKIHKTVVNGKTVWRKRVVKKPKKRVSLPKLTVAEARAQRNAYARNNPKSKVH